MSITVPMCVTGHVLLVMCYCPLCTSPLSASAFVSFYEGKIMLSLKGSGPAVFMSGLDGCSFQLAWILPEVFLAPQTCSSLPTL